MIIFYNVKIKTPSYCKINLSKILRKKVFNMYFNTQEDVITRIEKSLEKSLILRKKNKKFSKHSIWNGIRKNKRLLIKYNT